jgi:membrane protease YdiL (CAAX protease family)
MRHEVERVNDAAAASPRLPGADARFEADAPPPWGWRECLVGLVAVLVVLVLAVAVVSIIAAVHGGVRRGVTTIFELWIGLGATLVFEAALFGVAAAMSAGKYPGGLGLLGWRPRPPREWLPWSGLALVLSWGTLLAYSVITALPGLDALRPHGNVPQGLFDHAQIVPVAIVLTVVAAPVAEETFFRGFMFAGLRGSLGFAAAASVSGLLFALFHASASLIIPFTVIGVVFAYTYYRTGTLWANVTTHVLFNLVSVVLVLAQRGGS